MLPSYCPSYTHTHTPTHTHTHTHHPITYILHHGRLKVRERPRHVSLLGSLPGCAEQLPHKDACPKGLSVIIAYTPRTIVLYPFGHTSGLCKPSSKLELQMAAGDVLVFTTEFVHSGAAHPVCKHTACTQCRNQKCISWAVHAYIADSGAGAGMAAEDLTTELVDECGTLIPNPPPAPAPASTSKRRRSAPNYF